MKNFTAIFIFAAALFIVTATAHAQDEQRFNSPEEAVSALATAVTNKNLNAIHAIFGTDGRNLVTSDVVDASNALATFEFRVAQKVEIVPQSDTKDLLNLGADAWPFPIPLVKQKGKWLFDSAAGREEILNRRIGRNELGAIAVCRAYVDAQREYADEPRTQGGVRAYAQHLRSTSGTHDGLYWPAKDGEAQSPLGPLVAAAREEGYRKENKILTEKPAPYHGYNFKILTQQGSHAPAGKFNYLINGRMLAGFALVAWPADWGNTGVMTFIVNQDGTVYEKNLGQKTPSRASSMTSYDPDSSWKPVEE